jgi:hypothetical protein
MRSRQGAPTAVAALLATASSTTMPFFAALIALNMRVSLESPIEFDVEIFHNL